MLNKELNTIMPTKDTKKYISSKNVSKIIYADESYKIVGACFNVYKQMGCGFLESVYPVK